MKKMPINMFTVGIPALVTCGLIYGFLFNFGRITLPEAQRICDDHNHSASTEVNNLKSYSVIASAVECRPRYSELGNDGYIVASTFLLAKQQPNNQLAIVTKADAEQLKNELLVFQDGWYIHNILDGAGQSSLICISTGGYFKYDGKFYDHNGRLHTQDDETTRIDFFSELTDLGYGAGCVDKSVRKSLL